MRRLCSLRTKVITVYNYNFLTILVCSSAFGFCRVALVDSFQLSAVKKCLCYCRLRNIV